jgi:hypothetical protein
VGRSASSARAPDARAIVRACSHTTGSSSGPEATITFAPARPTSSVACSVASAGLIGAKIPVASAASSSGSSSAQLIEMTATASPRSTPNSPSTFAARWTSAASSPNVRRTGACQRSASGSTDAAVRSGQSAAARVTSS